MRILVSLLLIFPVLSFADAVDYDTQSITIALLQEPPNLDSTRTTDLVSFFVIGHVNEGLVRYDRRGRLVPGVAASWDVTPDAITFRLRDDARWSDGSRVTAADFVYAWRLINDPAYAAPYAAIMYPIKNAEKVQKGELPVTALGVQAVDDTTLVVSLEAPCGYCVALMVHAAFYPVKESFRDRQGESYGADASNLLYNGPFKLTEWVHGARLVMEANENYWDKDDITLRRITVGYITDDNRTRLNLFRDGRIALARLGAETVKDAASEGLRLRTFLSGGMAYLRFNLAETRITADPRLRRAIQLVFDPEEFVNKVIAIPGYRPAYSFFPSWIQGANEKFLDEYPPKRVPLDADAARKLVDEVKQDNGGTLPTITLLTVTSPTGAKIAEYFQGLLKTKLGLDVKVDQQIFKLYIDKNQKGLFDIALSSWYPDFDDIVTFADLMASWNPNNRGRYQSEEYDKYLRVVMRSADQSARMEAASHLDDIIRRDVPVLPMAETGSAYLQNPKLKGAIRRVLGADPDYTYARVVE